MVNISGRMVSNTKIMGNIFKNEILTKTTLKLNK
jgi:hypothetical protein